MDMLELKYIFFSHSQKDIEKVRKVRDYLESKSFEPILFNLKCFTDSDEPVSLIKREINTRRWFIYLESANAIASTRVQAEVEYAKTSNKQVFKLNLEQKWWLQRITLDRIVHKMRG